MKTKIKSILNKVGNVLSLIFGYGIMLSLFIGGLSFVGYVVALIIGGDVASYICTFIYKGIYPYLVYITSILVLLGLLVMYLRGETVLSSAKKKPTEKETKTDQENNEEKNIQVSVENKNNLTDTLLPLQSDVDVEDKKK